MSNPKYPQPAKLIINLLMKEKNFFISVAKDLNEKFGPIDMLSKWFDFDYTSYDESEMGVPLFKRALVFKNLINQIDLAEIKIITNKIEFQYSQNSKRMVNIDPGYLLLSRFVLATGKNFAHRIYIGKNIYADLTLIYQKGEFVLLPWTYPDYADKKMLTFLKQVRKKYAVDCKRLTASF